jgi:hypothetical protein
MTVGSVSTSVLAFLGRGEVVRADDNRSNLPGRFKVAREDTDSTGECVDAHVDADAGMDDRRKEVGFATRPHAVLRNASRNDTSTIAAPARSTESAGKMLIAAEATRKGALDK